LSIFYLCNASVLLGHLDLGWHLAAGNLIRSQGFIPSQDPWAFTLGDKQWFNLSWLWDVLASATPGAVFLLNSPYGPSTATLVPGFSDASRSASARRSMISR